MAQEVECVPIQHKAVRLSPRTGGGGDGGVGMCHTLSLPLVDHNLHFYVMYSLANFYVVISAFFP
jgi:hypothetical protein